MKEFNILLLPGDGIGPEITEEAVKILNTVSKIANLKFNFNYGYIGGIAIDKFEDPYPEETKKLAEQSDAVLLAAVGGPKWDTTDPNKKRPEDGLLALRKYLNVYANLRPVKVFPQLINASPLKPEIVAGTDLLIVRELTSGIYFGEKGRKDSEAYDVCNYSYYEIERTIRRAFEISRKRRKKLTLVDKANVLETSRFWREVFNRLKDEYPDIETEILLVDNAAMQLVRRPSSFDVMVTENMFGDILSDEAATISGSIGLLASASTGEKHPYLYEPIHGSAPDIAGKGVANPLGMILSVSMMLKYSFNLDDISRLIDAAVEKALEEGYRTADIASGEPGEKLTGTSEMGDIISEFLFKLSS